MNLNDFFVKNIYDNKPFLIRNGKNFSVSEIKKYVAYQCEKFFKIDIENVVLLPDSNFDFIINFFAAIFAKKEIYLINDKTRLSHLDFEFILPENDYKISEKNLFCNINPNEIFINCFTSGSTSCPKKIKKSLHNLITEGQDFYNQFRENILQDNIFVSSTNLTHAFGIACHFFVPFCSGKIIDTDRVFYPEELDSKDNYILISTPSFLEKIMDYELKNYPKLIVTAGAKLSQKAFEFFEKKSHVIEIYGSTETGTIAYKSNSATEKLTLLNKVSMLPDFNNVTVKSDYFLEKFVTINDAYEMVSDDEFILKSRTDRIVKIAEKRVSLVEIETILNSHNFIQESYCFELNGKLCAAVKLSDLGKDFLLVNGTFMTIKNIKNIVKFHSEIIPKRWRFLYEIPKNLMGKFDKNILEKIFNMNLSFPFILDKKLEQNSVIIKMVFLKNSNFFDGHFRDFPILPGVVQLFYASYFSNDIFGVDVSSNIIKKMKFSNIIRPDSEVFLCLENKEFSVDYKYYSDDKIYSSGVFVK